MAVKRDTRYPGRWSPADADFPLGGPKNRTTSTSNDGSYFNRDFIADYEAFFQRIMAEGGVTANETPDTAPTSQFYSAFERSFYKSFLFMGLPISTVGYTPNSDIFLPSGRVELLRSEYETVFEIVSSNGLTSQATIDADPRTYAGHWGDGNGSTTFTTDDWALMMNIKVAGGYGAAGLTKEDHIQNITGDARWYWNGSVTGSVTNGALSVVSSGVSPGNTSGTNQGEQVLVSFDASLSARTDTYTDTMGLFLDHYRVIPKGVFIYA